MKYICVFILLFINIFNVSAEEVMMDHSHMPIDVPDTVAVPALSLHIVKDIMSGYNLTLKVQRYTLIAPPEDISSMMGLMEAHINKKSGFIEGHAHLYVNGIKIQRIYGEHIHIPQNLFKNGINTVSVTLNNHGHMYWVADGKQVLATLYVNEAQTPFVTYQFESFPVQ